MTNRFQEKLASLKAQNLYRQPPLAIKKNQLLNFCSNDYLSLAQNKKIKNAAIKAIEDYGVGAKASRYVFSENSFAKKLEENLAKLKNCHSAMVLGSGYLSGVGIIPALVGDGDLIVADKLIHSSLLDGCKLSGAKLLRFKHNDLDHCQHILSENPSYKKRLIITETVFSMDGDLGLVDELLELAKKYDCLLLSDDAHGLGVIQKIYKKYEGDFDRHLQCGTLSKAAGGYGGYVCGSNLMIDYLRNFTKSAIYSTALPACVLAANLQAIKIISKDKTLGGKSLANAEYFCQLLDLPEPKSTIVPIIVGEASKALEISQKLRQNGFLISAIRPPTVEVGKSRLRITFCANHKKNDIKKLSELIKIYAPKRS